MEKTPIDSGLPKGVPTGGLFDTGADALGVAIQVILIAAIFFSLLTIIRGGLNMITSGGDKQRFQMGRERIRYAILGLIVVLLSFLLVNFLGRFFGVNLLGQPNSPLIRQPTPTRVITPIILNAPPEVE